MALVAAQEYGSRPDPPIGLFGRLRALTVSNARGFEMDFLMKRVERDGRDVARRFLIARANDDDIAYLRGELAGLSRAAWYVTGEDISEVEKRWLAEASEHFTVSEYVREEVAAVREP